VAAVSDTRDAVLVKFAKRLNETSKRLVNV